MSVGIHAFVSDPNHPLICGYCSREEDNETYHGPTMETKLEQEPIACMDCGLDYEQYPLDVALKREQWLLIHPDDGGVLCANCIVARAAKLPNVINVSAHITFGSDFCEPVADGGGLPPLRPQYVTFDLPYADDTQLRVPKNACGPMYHSWEADALFEKLERQLASSQEALRAALTLLRKFIPACGCALGDCNNCTEAKALLSLEGSSR